MKCDEIFAALAMLEKERGISQTFMMDKIIQALITAYKRDHEGVENVIVDVDEVKRDLKMFVQKTVVEEVENPGTEISLEDARPKFRGANVGDTVNIPAGVKHWHGAAPDCWFQHLAMEAPGENGRTEWLEPVDDAAYAKAVK